MFASIVLKEYSEKDLLELIDFYHVKTHEGKSYSNDLNINPLEFIEDWLKPDTKYVNRNANMALVEGIKFEYERTDTGKLTAEFRRLTSATGTDPVIIKDLADYPVKPHFASTIKETYLLMGQYLDKIDSTPIVEKDIMFENITGKSARLFLNDIEKVFYMSRGYGRPNKHISKEDLKMRVFLLNQQPTALTVLNIPLAICVTNFSLRNILNRLSDIDLRDLSNPFHMKIMGQVTKYLNEGDLAGFEELLTSIGMVPYADYDELYNVYETNLTQLESYANVIVNRKFSIQEVNNLPDILVDNYIRTLSDQEIFYIKVSLMKTEFHLFPSLLEEASIQERLRNNLVHLAVTFLTKKKYYIISRKEPEEFNKISYTRLVNTIHPSMGIDKFGEELERNECLLSPFEVIPISVTEANKLVKLLSDFNHPKESQIISRLIARTQAYIHRNDVHLRSLDKEVKHNLAHQLSSNLNGDANIDQLIIYSYSDHDNIWIPVALTVKEYLDKFYPRNEKLIQDSRKYYAMVLGSSG